ncbi:hypothetical protein F441_00018 [Phytophthora nicotianae CJ01A1]|nr:hypothetical protein F441_00018 [Phytophthora nicotianae CJ01A1]
MSDQKQNKAKSGFKRQPYFLHNNLDAISKKSIRRLARRAGVIRMSAVIYEEARAALKRFVVNLVQDTVVYTQYANRRTVTMRDVVCALKRQGRPIYGFD